MIDALVAGTLYGLAKKRTGPSGRPFVTAKLRAAISGGESVFVNAITFSDSVGAALLALADGDAVTLAGSLAPKVWTDRDGHARPALDMVAHAALTAYHVQRRRKAVQAASTTTRADAALQDDPL
ncbi:single-stranded DNA-binding protein [Paraburkholderia guartelaensis]|uniref:single-stranded DNA-binding protein n=1 Tax=Paraburkholderia guartelaensis TaxID=2546446 RepID=UPI002AB783BF|nr:single-stranded DNA-binding protein [Paraburkholderia guartelaensis]